MDYHNDFGVEAIIDTEDVGYAAVYLFTTIDTQCRACLFILSGAFAGPFRA